MRQGRRRYKAATKGQISRAGNDQREKTGGWLRLRLPAWVAPATKPPHRGVLLTKLLLSGETEHAQLVLQKLGVDKTKVKQTQKQNVDRGLGRAEGGMRKHDEM